MPPEVGIEVDGDVGRLRWADAASSADARQAVSLVVDEAFAAGLRRIRADVGASERTRRHALHRCGFRLEGRLRQARPVGDGSFEDLLVYARLATDETEGARGFSGVMDSVLPRKRLIGHAVAQDGAGRVLLLETSYKDDWELPGGVVEPGESPRVGAEREILEELGIETRLGEPVVVDWMPPRLGWSDAVEFVYDLGRLSDHQIARMRPDHEISAFHWVAPDRVGEHVTALSARRIALVLAGRPVHTEAGWPLGGAGGSSRDRGSAGGRAARDAGQ